jgi:cytoskeletal protein RodZ
MGKKKQKISQTSKGWASISLVLALILVLGLIALCCFVMLYAHKHRNTQTTNTAQTTPTVSDKGQTDQPSSVSSSSNPAPTNTSSQPGDTKSNVGGATDATLLAPTASNFVSAHHVNMSTPIASVCNTTPGVTCQIIFTNSSNGSIKKLSAQTTDRGGSAYWNNWTPASIGLTPGMWQIQAMATLGGQTKSANDATPLEVSS